MTATFAPDLDLVTRTLKVCGVELGEAERVSEVICRLREENKIPTEDLIDWLYEQNSKSILPEFNRWLSRREAKPCAFCGNPGGVPCDFRLGWNRGVPVNCDLRACQGCSENGICQLHINKKPLDSILTAGITIGLRKQMQINLEQWKASGGRETFCYQEPQQAIPLTEITIRKKKQKVVDGYCVFSKPGAAGELFVDTNFLATTAEFQKVRHALRCSDVAFLPRFQAPRLKLLCQQNGVPIYMRASL